MRYAGYLRTVNIKVRKPEPGEIDNEKWQSCVFFESEEEAKEFEDKLKKFILTEYPRAKEQGWFE